MPPNTVYVGRPTMWGNPWSVEAFGRAEAVSLYRSWLDGTLSVDEAAGGYGRDGLRVTRHPIERRKRIQSALPKLWGKNLACWCPLDAPCHADVLLEFANQ
jgi:hypothetical protein